MARTEGLQMVGGGDVCYANSVMVRKTVRFARGPFPKYGDGHPPEKSCEEERRRYRKGLTLQRSCLMPVVPSCPDDDLDFNVNWFEQAVMSSTSCHDFDPCRCQPLAVQQQQIGQQPEDGPSDTALMIDDDDDEHQQRRDEDGDDERLEEDDDDDVLAPGTVLETIALHPEPPNLCRDSVTSIEEYPLTPRPPGKAMMKPSGSSASVGCSDDDGDGLLKGLDPRDSGVVEYDEADLEALWSGAGGSDECGANVVGLDDGDEDGWGALGIGSSDIKRLEEGTSGCWPVVLTSLGRRNGLLFGGPCQQLQRGSMRGGLAGVLATCGCCTGNVRRLFWGLFMVCSVVLTITTVRA